MRIWSVVTLVAVCAQSCTSVSSATKSRLREQGTLLFVRAPTPLVPARVRHQEKDPELSGVVIGLGVLVAGLALLTGRVGGFGTGGFGLGRTNTRDAPTQVNATSRFGVPDAADLLALATLQEWKALGYPEPGIAPGVVVRFDNAPERWPAEAHVSSEYLLHAQIDRIEVGDQRLPKRLLASATLFNGERVEVRTSCDETPQPGEAEQGVSEAWVALVRRCAKVLLAPYADTTAGRGSRSSNTVPASEESAMPSVPP